MNAFEMKDVTKHYQGFCLDRMSLTLPMGCIMGLVGENGAGKSTTIKLILNMSHKDGGSITVLGKNHSENTSLIKEDIGVVFDEVGIPDCLNAKQVGMVMKYSYRNWREDQYMSLVQRLSLPLDKPFKDFSRGMKMKLGIAIALSHEAKLLLMDEATSGLDPVVRDEILTMLNDFTRDENHAVLLSSHIVSDLEKSCDYIAFMHQGRLLLCEEKDRLLEQYGLVRCTKESLPDLPSEAILHQNETPYGVEALVLRNALAYPYQADPIGLEELFVLLMKEVG